MERRRRTRLKDNRHTHRRRRLPKRMCRRRCHPFRLPVIGRMGPNLDTSCRAGMRRNLCRPRLVGMHRNRAHPRLVGMDRSRGDSHRRSRRMLSRHRYRVRRRPDRRIRPRRQSR